MGRKREEGAWLNHKPKEFDELLAKLRSMASGPCSCEDVDISDRCLRCKAIIEIDTLFTLMAQALRPEPLGILPAKKARTKKRGA